MARRFPVILTLALVAGLRVPAAADSDVANKSEAASSEDIWKRNTFTGDWGGVRKSLENGGVTFTVEEYGGLWANLTGGLRPGGAYVGLTDASLKLDLAKLMNWQGATFFVNAYQIHGFGPSENFVGNQQFVSNIEATPSRSFTISGSSNPCSTTGSVSASARRE
jgi:porin